MRKILLTLIWLVFGCAIVRAQTTDPTRDAGGAATRPSDADHLEVLLAKIQNKSAVLRAARAQKDPNISQIEDNFSGAWSDTLEFAGTATAECQAEVMHHWVEAWKADADSKLLIEALRFSKQRVFLTDHIIDIFLKTDDVEVARSIAMVMVYNGKPEDLSTLQKKLQTVHGREMTDMLNGAISWKNYNNHPDGPGPQRIGF